MNTNRTTTWNKKKPTTLPFLHPNRSPLLLLLLLLFTLLFSAFLLYSSSKTPAKSRINPQTPKFCETRREKFLWYAPHSGFSNQVSEFKNALLFSGILNRTLVVPPVLDHHAVVLGSCPKFRVTEPNAVRSSVWDHALHLIRTGRYVSMADIVDISALAQNFIRVIDFRDFVSQWCNVNVDLACGEDLNVHSSFFDRLLQCGSLASGVNGNIDKCLYAVDEDCRTTVWTYNEGNQDGVLDSFQPDEQLKKKKKLSYVRVRRDIFRTLGLGSKAGSSTVLAFGTLFTAVYKGSQSYIDIHKAPNDARIQSLLKKMEFLPFAPEIVGAGKKFALETIKSPFLCAQLRLLDGQFKNHWEPTFLGLKQKLESLKGTTPKPINIFLMTDLPQDNWTSCYLGELASNSKNYKMYFLREEDELVKQTAEKLVDSGHSLRFGTGTLGLGAVNKLKMDCSNKKLPEILLYIEEIICSCASLGFVGTAGSTIAESIEQMRNHMICSTPGRTAA